MLDQGLHLGLYLADFSIQFINSHWLVFYLRFIVVQLFFILVLFPNLNIAGNPPLQIPTNLSYQLLYRMILVSNQLQFFKHLIVFTVVGG